MPTLVVRVSANAKKLALSPRSFLSVSLHCRNCSTHKESPRGSQFINRSVLQPSHWSSYATLSSIHEQLIAHSRMTLRCEASCYAL